MSEKLSPSQVRGARGMLDWSMLDLAQAAGVSVSTVKRLEMREDFPLSDGIRTLVRAALEAAGVTFVEDDGRGNGVRFKATGDRGTTGG